MLAWQDGRLWALEIKRFTAPKLGRGFHLACADLAPARRFLVHPGRDSWPLGDGLEAIGVGALCERLAASDWAGGLA